jgi:3-deoxy-D-manno-octulosonate 8-phosphate phosphatase (KDO 8-P phosphatase)
MATMNGYHVGIITGGRSGSIVSRFKSCKIPQEDIYLGSRNKMKDFDDFCKRHSLNADEVMYFGDDLPDITVIKACGAGVCPCDAVPEVKEAADIVSSFPGGKGCVREVVESVMKRQGKWIFNVDQYTVLF